MALEQDRIKAQSYLDMMKSISDNFNGGSPAPASPNGKQSHIGKDGKVLGYWENSSKFVYTNGDDVKLSEYSKKVKDLGFTWLGGAYKALTTDEYAKARGEMVGGSSNSGNVANSNTSKSVSTPFVWTPMKKVFAGVLAIGAVLGILKLTKVI